MPAKAMHLGTWDVENPGGPWRRDPFACLDWWGKHMRNVAGKRCYRADFYVLDCAFVVTWSYDENDSGHIYLNGNGNLAQLPPRGLILSELPPPHLLGWDQVIPVHTMAFRHNAELAWQSDRGNCGWDSASGNLR